MGVSLHPTQLYESLAEFLIFAWLYRRFHQPYRPGEIIGQYLILYSVVRFLGLVIEPKSGSSNTPDRAKAMKYRRFSTAPRITNRVITDSVISACELSIYPVLDDSNCRI